MQYLTVYFNIIRKASSLGRSKKDRYYEAHHIIPQCFNKKSLLVLLTPREHFICHRLLALAFKDHPIYSKKLWWAYHRLSYDGVKDRFSSRYYESIKQEIYDNLWSKPKSKSHRDKISRSRKGKKTIINPKTGDQIYIDISELNNYINEGWINSHKSKGKKRSEETKKLISENTTRRLTGKIGNKAQASKGTVVYENVITGEKIEAGSALQLSYIIKISPSTISSRLSNKHGIEYKGFKIYYKNNF